MLSKYLSPSLSQKLLNIRFIYTTNTIESLNFSLRKVTKNKSSFPDDDSIYKIMNLAIKNASTRWTMPIKEWVLAVNQFATLFLTISKYVRKSLINL